MPTSAGGAPIGGDPANIDEDKRTKMKGFYENLLKNNTTRNQGGVGGSTAGAGNLTSGPSASDKKSK